MRVLVTGSRDWNDHAAVCWLLNGLYDAHEEKLVVIEGGARGADECACRWAQAMHAR